MATVFTKIISGEIPSFTIAETANFISFLDINPLKEGHTLVVPKKEIDNIFDLDDDLLAEMHIFTKKIAKAIENSFDCKKVGMAVVGLEVPHAHIHLIPIDEVSEMDFSQEKIQHSRMQIVIVMGRIKESLNS
jgi:histidine triad (HIT) family protein